MSRTGLTEYEAAVAVAKHRNFRAAALELGTSPTSLSSTIRALEARIGVQLFNRTTRSVALTATGETFISRVSASVTEIRQAIEEAQGKAQEPSGTLRINSSISAAHEILLPLIAEFLRRYPAMTVDLVTETRLVDIVLKGFDAGIRVHDSVPADMVAIRLGYSLDFTVVGSPDYLARHPAPTTPAELMNHCCIRARWVSGGIYRWEIGGGAEKFDLDVPGNIILDDQSLILKAARAGLGLACIANAFARDAIVAGDLIPVLEDWKASPAPLSLYYPRSRHPAKALQAFVEVIRGARATAAG
ncbi:LysR family transcriptional regulator [Bradyrhizobium cenepequi]|uniref:LysR family transcriptional regulator n=1 Tax=Bradyrhizobium cenepequi TaxID=2821403 RepID=UPI001CE31A4C|nr:LysR family transcriptional regulator [Bradyrhizobium cenepequi]MCA6111191.1 LysR family transcriptional regulator [Bradyrhizobium cenepequi]